jgi:hypothetical protein
MSQQRVWAQRVAQSGGASNTWPPRPQVPQRGQPKMVAAPHGRSMRRRTMLSTCIERTGRRHSSARYGLQSADARSAGTLRQARRPSVGGPARSKASRWPAGRARAAPSDGLPASALGRCRDACLRARAIRNLLPGRQPGRRAAARDSGLRRDRTSEASSSHAAQAPPCGPLGRSRLDHLHAATHGCRDALTCISKPICRRPATGDPERMYASPTADLGRPAKLRLTPARLYVFAALICGAAGLAPGQPAGVRWALLVFGAAFLSATLQAALDPPASTPGSQSRARGNSVPRRLDLRRAVAESRGRTRRCGRRAGF